MPALCIFVSYPCRVLCRGASRHDPVGITDLMAEAIIDNGVVKREEAALFSLAAKLS